LHLDITSVLPHGEFDPFVHVLLRPRTGQSIESPIVGIVMAVIVDMMLLVVTSGAGNRLVFMGCGCARGSANMEQLCSAIA
jgi:hypothetical protein